MTMQVRKITMDENPGVKFGEISRIVAERWRGMSDADKQVGDQNKFTRLIQVWHRTCSLISLQAYAERAKKVNEDKEKEEARREAERIRFRLI